MMRVVAFLVEHGAMLATGATVLLLLGTLATLLARAPLHRQRIGEMSVLATLVWVVLACLPLPRVGFTRPADRPTPNVGAIRVPSEVELTDSEIPAELIARPQRPFAAAAFEKSARKHVDLRPWVAWAFLGGAGLSLGWLILGHAVLWRLIRGAAPAPARVRGMIGDGARALVCGRLSRPVTCGVFRPIILLPAALLDERCAVQLRQVLLHERGHVEQRDGLGSLLFSLALPGLYFHPLYWWLRRSCALARELVVDDRAARADGKAAYVTHLIALARGSRAAMSISPVGAIGILQIRSHFYRRMTMLLQRRESLATRCSRRFRAGMILTGVLAVISSACVLGVRPALAQEQPGAGAGADEKGQPSVEDRLRARRRAAELEAGRGGGAEADPRARQSVDVTAGAPDERRRDAEQALGELSAAQVGMIDPTMRQMLAEHEDALQELARLRAAGAPADDAKMKQLELVFEAQQKRIDDYLKKWREAQLQTRGAGVPARRPGAAPGGDPRAGAMQVTYPAVGGVQLDLVNLGNSMVDASGALRLAKVRYQRLANMANAVSQLEKDEAESNLITAEKRLKLLRGIAKVALSGASEELNRMQKLYQTGMANGQSLAEMSAKVQMLELILQSAD